MPAFRKRVCDRYHPCDALKYSHEWAIAPQNIRRVSRRRHLRRLPT